MTDQTSPPPETDLWNLPIGAFKRKNTKRDESARGYPARPGGGPEGEICRTCKHLCRLTYAKTYLKCGLIRRQWTSSPKTDIRAKSPACQLWEANDKGMARGASESPLKKNGTTLPVVHQPLVLFRSPNPYTTMNLILQKVRAAEMLPDMLTIYNRDNDHGVCWKGTDSPVTAREWLAVMHEAEKRLSFEQRYPYIKRLGYGEGRVWDGSFNGLDAGWQMRLEAYVHVIGKWETPTTNKEENEKSPDAGATE